MVTKYDSASDMVGNAKASVDDPIWKVYIYNQSKDNPRRLQIDMLKSEVRKHIFEHVADQTVISEGWKDLPKKKY